MNDLWMKVIGGVLTALVLISIGSIFSMRDTLQSLVSYRDDQWPLEKQLLLVEHQQLEAAISVVESSAQARFSILEADVMLLDMQLRSIQ